MMDPTKHVYLISLGCAKNRVDSENIAGMLIKEGFSVVASIEEAEVAIINTCGFIESAVEESIETILEVAGEKERGKLKQLFVVGCFVQRYGYKLRAEIPEVDGWLGTAQIHRIVELLEKVPERSPPFFISKPDNLFDHSSPRVQSTPFCSAYLKIAEGCSHRCTFCTIPSLRGPLRSRKLESILFEAERLVERGVREINLIAQDTTMYGADLERNTTLEDLLERLLRIKGISWIRVLYSHPLRISDRLLDLIDGEEAICPYIDLPLQHINDRVLTAMGRPFNGENPWQLIDRIKSRTRRLSLRTTFMVGFPGETEGIFNELYHFVESVEFDHMGAFVFSREKGTPAGRYQGAVDRLVAEKRRADLMGLQGEISKRKNQELLDRVVPVLIEGVSPETELLLKGRTSTMAPDVDSQVLINRGQVVMGEIVPVRITEAHTYDLVGEVQEGVLDSDFGKNHRRL